MTEVKDCADNEIIKDIERLIKEELIYINDFRLAQLMIRVCGYPEYS